MIKNIFFDLDDTLIDFKGAERESLTATLRGFGIPHGEKELSRYSEINRACWERLEKKEYTMDEVLTKRFVIFFGELGITADVAAVRADYERRLAEGARPIVGARDILAKLYGKHRLFVVTNGISRSQHSRISHAGLEGFFERVFVSEDIGCEKPAPEFFERVLHELRGVQPTESLLVGDSVTSDIPAGRGASMYTCLFNPEGKAPSGVTPPDFEIKRLSEITEIIKTIG